MDEGRKRVILIAAAILASHKLAQQDSARPSPASVCAIHDAIVPLANRLCGLHYDLWCVADNQLDVPVHNK